MAGKALETSIRLWHTDNLSPRIRFVSNWLGQGDSLINMAEANEDEKRSRRKRNLRKWKEKSANPEPEPTASTSRKDTWSHFGAKTSSISAFEVATNRLVRRPIIGQFTQVKEELKTLTLESYSRQRFHSGPVPINDPYQRTWEDSRYKAKACRIARTDFLFSLMSYNVLADEYMKSHLYLYQDTPEKHLNWSDRFPKLVAEIVFHSPDIVCLQEVQAEHFTDFQNELTHSGYDGVYKQKTLNKPDGCAIFFQRDKFSLEDSHGVEFFQPGTFSLDRPNIAMIVKLRPTWKVSSAELSNPDQRLIVATTHLLYNPKRHDVKLAQTVLLLAEMDRISWAENGQRHPCIITGDFNMTPFSPTYNLVTEGRLIYKGLNSRTLTEMKGMRSSGSLDDDFLPEWLGIDPNCQHIDTIHNRANPQTSYNSEGHRLGKLSRSKIKGFPMAKSNGTFTHELWLRSAYKHSPRFQNEGTTFQNGWVTVDYIFYSTMFCQKFNKAIEGNLKLLSTLKCLSQHQYQNVKRIPNHTFPSDHICLMTKFLLKNRM